MPACYECHLPPSAYERIAERYSCGWLRKAAWSERKVPTTTITASVAGALATSAALRLGVGTDTGARRMFVDTVAGGSTVSRLERQPECVGCGVFASRPRIIAARNDWERRVSEISGAGGKGEASILRPQRPDYHRPPLRTLWRFLWRGSLRESPGVRFRRFASRTVRLRPAIGDGGDTRRAFLRRAT